MTPVPEKMRPVLLLCLSLLLAPAAAQWTGRLEGGGEVVVDPVTNRATVTRNGVSTPLWDGVHRLEDGSVLTVRSGQVVPNEAILRARRPPPKETDLAATWVGTPFSGPSPCEQLVQRVCGAGRQCRDAEACTLASQLLDREGEERARSAQPGTMTYSSGQCQEAARDTAFFQTCRP